MKADQVPAETLSRVESELLPGEELLWVERPGMPTIDSLLTNPTSLSGIGGLLLVLVMFLFVFPSFGAFNLARMSPIFMLVPLIMIGTVVWQVVMPIITRMNSIYALTNRRALIINGGSTRSFTRDDIEFIERRMARNGTGDVTFAKEVKTRYSSSGSRRSSRLYTVPVGFFGVRNPQYVEALMLDVFRSVGDAAFDKAKNDDQPDLYDVEIGPDGELQPRKRSSSS
ncbi:MAG TPA: hypothetical protein PKX07_08635 [Aggregatilineales bacterium]|nr:hypothetical protein [Aggregatilineales bacterium]